MSINKKALKVVVDGTLQERQYLCSRDFSLFLCYYFVDYIKFPFADFHFEMFGDLKKMVEGVYREVAWIMFRESAKTSFAKIFLAWIICYKKRLYCNVDSFDKENAERMLFDIVVELQTNPRIKNDFGELFNAKRNPDEIQQKRVNNFVTNHGVRVEAHSTQESVRGRIHGHQRPDFLIIDDFETNKTKDSKAYTEQVIDHINEFKSGLDSQAIILYLGNYITEYGSVKTLMDRAQTDSRLKVRMVPVVLADGSLAWPQKYTVTGEAGKIDLNDKKIQLGSQVFNAEMMNQPIDNASQEFFHKWFKPIEWERVKNMRVRKFATLDTALSRKSESDATGCVRNYVDEDNNWMLDAREYRFNSKGLIDLIFQLKDEGFEKIGIEETAFTEAIEPFFLDECRLRNSWPYVVPLKHGGVMKESRIRGLIPRYEAGTIFHIIGRCDVLEEQLVRFPNALHDDVADAAQYQNKIAEPPFPEDLGVSIGEDKPAYADIGV